MEQGVKSIHFESLPLFCSPPDFTRFSQSSSIFQNFWKPYPPHRPHPLYKGGVLVHTMKEVNHFTTTIQPTTVMLTLKKILVWGRTDYTHNTPKEPQLPYRKKKAKIPYNDLDTSNKRSTNTNPRPLNQSWLEPTQYEDYVGH